ncbi:MAG TPA: flagellar biosynthesis protein FliQ [Planctomycetaceae bacterium]|jgi:flagellar biosynthetic protein FliQ|nr:flagellar biosynthesis protein FliQ [Planctomycetaceae bacterium]
MTPEQSVELVRGALFITLLLGTPLMVVAVVVGLIISMMQAVTQIQEQTLSFVPKIIIMLLTGLLTLPWAINQMVEYSTTLFRNIPTNL